MGLGRATPAAQVQLPIRNCFPASPLGQTPRLAMDRRNSGRSRPSSLAEFDQVWIGKVCGDSANSVAVSTDCCLRAGTLRLSPAPALSCRSFRTGSAQSLLAPVLGGNLIVEFYPSVGMDASGHLLRGWCWTLPRPPARVTQIPAPLLHRSSPRADPIGASHLGRSDVEDLQDLLVGGCGMHLPGTCAEKRGRG